MSLPINREGLGRLLAHLDGFDASHLTIHREARHRVRIEWWGSRAGGDTRSDHADGFNADEALAKLLAELGDTGPCPVCGPIHELRFSELCETCQTRTTAARWDEQIDRTIEGANA